MTKHLIKTSPYKFFRLNINQLFKISLIGLLFGGLTICLTSWLSFGALMVNFRFGLIVAAVISLWLLLKNQIESAPLIVILTVVVLWNQWLELPHFWQAALFYGGLSAAAMTLFGWVSQLKTWQLRLAISLVVMVVLSVI